MRPALGVGPYSSSKAQSFFLAEPASFPFAHENLEAGGRKRVKGCWETNVWVADQPLDAVPPLSHAGPAKGFINLLSIVCRFTKAHSSSRLALRGVEVDPISRSPLEDHQVLVQTAVETAGKQTAAGKQRAGVGFEHCRIRVLEIPRDSMLRFRSL